MVEWTDGGTSLDGPGETIDESDIALLRGDIVTPSAGTRSASLQLTTWTHGLASPSPGATKANPRPCHCWPGDLRW